MNRFIRLLIHFVFCLCILGVGKSFVDIDDVDSHLGTYAEVNKSQHDNIDDTYQEHTHSHKHTEDGEEHEHHHEHSKVNQYEAKQLNQINYIKVTTKEFESTQGFFEKYLISSPHLLRLFKPPIA